MDSGSLPSIEIATNSGLEEANRSNPVKALKLEKRTRSPWLLAIGYFTPSVATIKLDHVLLKLLPSSLNHINALSAIVGSLKMCWLIGCRRQPINQHIFDYATEASLARLLVRPAIISPRPMVDSPSSR